MPNWCECDLNITGKAEDLDFLIAKVIKKNEDQEDFDFNAIIPMPEELKVTSGSSEFLHDILYSNRVLFDSTKIEDDSFVSFPDFILSRLEGFSDTVQAQAKSYLKRFLSEDKTLEEQEKIISDEFELVEKYKSNRENHGYVSWYNWSVANWGTKWNACDFSHRRIELKRSFQEKMFFTTAWSPPIPVITRLGEMFPQLKFSLKYYEGGCGYKGILTMQRGEVIKCSDGDYSGPRGG